MKWKFKRLLLKITLILFSLYAAIMIIGKLTQPQVDTYKVITPETQLSSTSQYIISEEMVLSKLHQESQIVSMSQSLEESFTHVDESWLGERQTEMSVKGTFKMGLETSGIDIRHIDHDRGIVHVKLSDPILISLEIPYDQVDFSKESGWLRLKMGEKEKQNYYKAVHKSIENDILHNEEILRQAKLFNEDSVRQILMLIDNVKGVVFE